MFFLLFCDTFGSAIALCEALGWPDELALSIGSEAARRLADAADHGAMTAGVSAGGQHSAVHNMKVEDAVAAMKEYLKLRGGIEHGCAAAERVEHETAAGSSQGWSPRSSSVK